MDPPAPDGTAFDRPPQLGISPTRLSFQCTRHGVPLLQMVPQPQLNPAPRAGTREEPGQLLRLRLTNRSTDRPTIYKVKTTAPKRYRVNPNAAEIQPGQTVEVKGAPCPHRAAWRGQSDAVTNGGVPKLTVLLLAMEDYPEPPRRRDRFLIQAAWSETSDVDVSERVSNARSMRVGAPL